MPESRAHPPYPLIAGVLCLLAALGVAVFVFVSRQPPAPEPVRLVTLTPRPSPAPTYTPNPTALPRIVVQVSGAVKQPGVYRIEAGARVSDAVTAAGGVTDDADVSHFNLARKAIDGELIIVPRIGETPVAQSPGSTAPTTAAPRTGKVNINTADAAELDTLPGIGPELAQRIIAYRQAHGPFARIEDLDNVSGIGPSTLERLRDLITVQ
ncbi:MAG: helix-hairpin-helix domain-containing protein [Chloroflexi bacterium]|nr:helix-hairpin-helix domain-containing protein [Chloroflexota bacterium]